MNLTFATVNPVSKRPGMCENLSFLGTFLSMNCDTSRKSEKYKRMFTFDCRKSTNWSGREKTTEMKILGKLPPEALVELSCA